MTTPYSANVKQPTIGVLFIFMLIGAVIGFQLGRWSNSYDAGSKIPAPGEKGCTLEAKLCPDGSTVGRSGPNCEFAPCPDFIPPPSPTAAVRTNGDCVKAGCSGQLCVPASESGINTTCEVKAEYSCLQYSSCEIQPSGECGWTQTPEYSSCLDNLRK